MKMCTCLGSGGSGGKCSRARHAEDRGERLLRYFRGMTCRPAYIADMGVSLKGMCGLVVRAFRLQNFGEGCAELESPQRQSHGCYFVMQRSCTRMPELVIMAVPRAGYTRASNSRLFSVDPPPAVPPALSLQRATRAATSSRKRRPCLCSSSRQDTVLDLKFTLPGILTHPTSTDDTRHSREAAARKERR